uniref:signal peptidase I n=1 Tax=Agathobacter sp. TaxID=2021311 RepID=UPI004055AA9A
MNRETENHKIKIKDMEILDLNDDEFAEMDEHANTGSLNQEIQQEKEESKKDKFKEFLNMVITCLVTIAVMLLLKNYVIINASVPTGSMENTIMPGDNLFGYRLAYLNEEPERGDIIFFYFPDDETQKYVKRIVGLPGEHVYITNGKIYIDDASEPLDEPYLKEEWVRGTGTFEFDVPEGCYLVLGDNRNSSVDSRFWVNPYVSKEKIIGKAIFVYFPFNRIGMLE